MVRDNLNVIPAGLALTLHVLILGSMVIAYDLSRPTPFTPLAVQATLVADIPETPIAQPEPEPVVPEPLPEPEPEPDNSEELRRLAEEEKRRQDALLEQERLEKLRQQEEEERRRKAREEEERKQREEAEKERRRIEAERKRQEDIRRQREENERLRREAENAARADEIAAEERQLAAVDSGALAVYMAQIRQRIERNCAVPASAPAELECSVRVRQVPGGEVVGVTILSCGNDAAVHRSVEAAIYRSSPLPEPSDPSLFDRNILLNLSIRQ